MYKVQRTTHHLENFSLSTMLDTVPEMKEKYFSHVSDGGMQTALAETLYGARWIYKLGLALLVQDEEQMAHVRVKWPPSAGPVELVS